MRSLAARAGVMAAAHLIMSACGSGSPTGAKSTPNKPANALAVLDRLDRSAMKDGTGVESVASPDGTILTGEGWVTFRPAMAEYALIKGTVNGKETFVETMNLGSVQYGRVGEMTQRDSMRWERRIWDRLVTTPSEYMLGLSKTSELILPEVIDETVGQSKAWKIAANAPDGLNEMWVRETDGFLLQYRITYGDGTRLTITVDRFNTSPKINSPPDSQVVDGATTCGFATSPGGKLEKGQRVCGLEAFGDSMVSVRFIGVMQMPEGVFPVLVDYGDNQSREGEGVTLTGGSARFHSESWYHEVDLALNNEVTDVVVSATYTTSGAAQGSQVGIGVRCAQSCVFFAVRPDGQWKLSEKVAGHDYRTVLSGAAEVNPLGSRLTVWADGDVIGLALDSDFLGTYKTSVVGAGPAFFFHRSLSKTAPSEADLLDLSFFQPTQLTLSQLMGG